jgi:GT2 family glycosyltransferase
MGSPVVTAPAEVVALAEQRQQARADKDFALSDQLRADIRSTGWMVLDTAEGFTLTQAPPFDSVPNVGGLPNSGATATRALGIGLVIDGWPDDTRTCIQALLDHSPADAVIVALDLGNVDGAGVVVHELAKAHPGRIEEFHVDAPLTSTGWAAARNALIAADTSEFHVVMDLSSVLEGDAFTPLMDMLKADEALLSYLFVIRRAAAVENGPHPKAKFYRNADMEWSLALREAGGKVAQGPADLPVRQDRHRGYHDSDPAMREKESKRTYDRLLQRFRAHPEVLAPRA